MTEQIDFGTPVTDIEDYLGAEAGPAPQATEPDPPAPARPAASKPAAWRYTALAVATLLAAAVGAWLMRAEPATTPSAATPPPPGVDGFAELFIATYLTQGGATGEAIKTFMAPDQTAATMSPLDRYVTRAATLQIETISDHYWDVTVATETLERTESGYVPTGIEHYRIAIMRVDGQLVVAAIPARVAGPPTPTTPPIRPLSDEVEPRLAEFTEEFLDSMLVGSHRLSRYTVPGSTIRAIEPYPYQSIELSGLASGVVDGRTYVSAAVTATTPTGMVHVVAYTLELVDDGGEWEVAAILPGPPAQQGSAPS